MRPGETPRETVEFRPVTRERWPDLDRLFQASAGEELGNPSRCWCMEWRLPSRAAWEQQAGEGNRVAMRGFIESGQVPGMLAYVDGEPAGWCSVSPRPTLIGLREVGQYRRFEDPTVWCIICFYVPEQRRGRGLMKALLGAAVEYATGQGARIVEAYPVTPEAFGDGAGGSIPVFEQAGFVDVARISDRQRVMRYYAEGAEGQR